MGTIGEALAAGHAAQLEQNTMFSGGMDYTPSVQTTAAHKPVLPEYSNSYMFGKSLLSALGPELIGTTLEGVDAYRDENKIGGITSWMLGAMPFFMLPQAKVVQAASKMIPGFTKSISLAEKLKTTGHPFKGGGLMEATKFAPLEAGRLVGSIFNPEEGSTMRTAAAAASELGFLSALGGTGAALGKKFQDLRFERLGPENSRVFQVREKRVSDHIGSSFPREGSIQERWAEVTKFKNRKDLVDDRIKGDIDFLLPQYEKIIKLSEPPRNPKTNATRYVAYMGSSAKTRRVESLFEEGSATGKGAHGILSRIFQAADPEKGIFNGYHDVLKKTGEKIRSATEEADLQFEGFLKVAGLSGVRDTWQGITQSPRKLQPASKDALGRLKEIIKQDFIQVEDTKALAGWRAQENANGAQVVIKMLKQQKPGEGHQYYIFKTHSPKQWFKGQAGVMDTNYEVYTRGLGEFAMQGSEPKKFIPTLMNTLGINKTMNLTLGSSLTSGKTRMSSDPNIPAEISRARLIWDQLMPDSVKAFSDPAISALKQVGGKLKIDVAPARLQGANNTRLAQTILEIEKLFQMQQARATDLILGPISDKFIRRAGASPMRSIFTNALHPDKRRIGGTQALFRKYLSEPAALEDFNVIRIRGLSPKEASKEGLHPDAVQLAVKLQVIDDKIVQEIESQAITLGMERSLIPKKGHYSIANSWIGPWRVPLQNMNGDVVGFASGYEKSLAIAEAVDITAAINEEAAAKGLGQVMLRYGKKAGKDVDLIGQETVVHAGSKKAFKDMDALQRMHEGLGLEAAATDISPKQADIFGFATQIRSLDDPLVNQIMQTRSKMFEETPSRFKKRTGFLGPRGTEGQPFSLAELETTHSAGIIESYRYLQREAILHGPLKEQTDRLMQESAGDALTLGRIFNSYNGVSGPVARTIEQATDAVLADIMGPGTATNFVRHTNEAMFFLTLGALDMGFAALNLITPIQTALPEAAMIMGASPEILQRYYSASLVKTATGGMKMVNNLDVFKFGKEAMRSVWNPTGEERQFIARLFDEHVVGREFIEAVHGGMRTLTEGKSGFFNSIKRISEAPVIATEEASRTYSAMLGRKVAKDFLGMADEEAFLFAKQFVTNTMYGYGAAERPRMLTGALGSGWGLFKNWTMNYTGNLFRYGAEASRGNWAPLMWTGASSGAVGGLAAMPLAGMADGFYNWMTDKHMSDFVYEMYGNDPLDESAPLAADFTMHGIFSLAGMTLRSRASAPSAHLQTDITMWANVAIAERVKGLTELVGTFIDDVSDFRIPMQDPKFRRALLRTFAPRTIQRAATGFADDVTGGYVPGTGYRSLRSGNSLLPALSVREAALNMFGLTPVRVANTFENQQYAWEDAEEQRNRTQLNGTRMADALMNKDYDEVRRIGDESILDGIPLDSVMNSAQARMRNMLEPFLSRQFKDSVTRQRQRNMGLER